MSNNPSKTKCNRLIPWILLLVFISPWISAQLIYTLRNKFTFKTLETGKLLTPPIRAQTLSFFDPSWLGQWQIIYLKPENCDAGCQTFIPNLNQVHLALGKEKHKVKHRAISIKGIAEQKTISFIPGEIIIMDPNGWLVMQYSPNPNPQDLLKDMRRLLRYSHEG